VRKDRTLMDEMRGQRELGQVVSGNCEGTMSVSKAKPHSASLSMSYQRGRRSRREESEVSPFEKVNLRTLSRHQAI
jgi:hypothetical protein